MTEVWVATFRERFRAAVEADRRKLTEVARYAGCRPATVSEVARGRSIPGLRLFRWICILLGTSADVMLGLDQCPECGRTVELEKAKTHCAPE